MRRSHISEHAILKNLTRVLGHPWIGAKLLKLEAEKTFFNLLHPFKSNGRAGKIRQVSLRITDSCNLRCRTCGQWGERGFLIGEDLKRRREAEVTPQRYLHLFRDLIMNGHRPMVYIWGGEPMLYPGILDLIDSASSLKLPVSIATNGTGLAEAAENFVKAPLFLLQVSIDGHCAELHNRLRPSAGNGNNFARIEKGLERMNQVREDQASTLPLIASLTVISNDNAHHLVDIYEAFKKRVDLFVFYLSWWMDEKSAALHEKDFENRFGTRPSRHRSWIGCWKPLDYSQLENQILELLSRSKRSTPVTLIPQISGAGELKRYYTDHQARFGYDQCVSIHQSIEINSNGDLSPCRDYHDYVVGNIKENSIVELWNCDSYKRFRRSLSEEGLMPVCSRCCGLMGY
ncbi:MAG: radical SAM protein [Desulfobacteraceae bacterium]|nr:MAG: radical SAM protein [Desulfobacteraceae bacterium]